MVENRDKVELDKKMASWLFKLHCFLSGTAFQIAVFLSTDIENNNLIIWRKSNERSLRRSSTNAVRENGQICFSNKRCKARGMTDRVSFGVCHYVIFLRWRGILLAVKFMTISFSVYQQSSGFSIYVMGNFVDINHRRVWRTFTLNFLFVRVPENGVF